MTLDQLPIGKGAVITVVGGSGALRRRLLDMGLTPKTRISVRKVELHLRGYELTLRRDDAMKIEVSPLQQNHKSNAPPAKGFETGGQTKSR